MWQRVQQMLLRRGINTYLELALWIALIYTVVGVVYAAFHIELIGQLEAALSGDFTIFANIAALVATVALWPVLLLTAFVCGVAGCGLF
ncbi:addiction module protein [Mycolicibacterium flavescens]|uniref:Addiction module protein n=1 Tax=Mycolicibacterium flavescens TaxID=1776 RepID=A0A1E3RFU1_MYCFV|nr:addiction module protein [Mycolicibacterium flavescens]MCV7282810.1 addiction module protein [Mycolicibacterium flavescens]ODQ88721.1 addiction module protein [Mycolicibacterium flavescens]